MVQWLGRWVCMRLLRGSNPVLTSGLDLFPVVPDSTLPRFVNSQLVASRLLGFSIMFLLILYCYFHLVNSGVPVN